MEDSEIKRIVKYLKDVAEPQFHPELQQLGKVDVSGMSRDEMFDDAVRIVLESKRGSVSLLQRRLSIGYARASRIIEMMGASGVLGEYKGSQAREVLLTLEEYEKLKNQGDRDAANGYAYAQDEGEKESGGDSYVTQGQKEYMAVEEEEVEGEEDDENEYEYEYEYEQE
ncbi:MAG: hypothetical protein ISS77_06550 [Phycisphaerae bacterium]|nr:hypothetical protein [Phycisphaerae bacterium]